MKEVPEDWVLLEAARRFEWPLHPKSYLRELYDRPTYIGFRALCDMIAKYEQPPVDPDVEAVKRILAASVKRPIDDINWLVLTPGMQSAVAQYKLERAK